MLCELFSFSTFYVNLYLKWDNLYISEIPIFNDVISGLV